MEVGTALVQPLTVTHKGTRVGSADLSKSSPTRRDSQGTTGPGGWGSRRRSDAELGSEGMAAVPRRTRLPKQLSRTTQVRLSGGFCRRGYSWKTQLMWMVVGLGVWINQLRADLKLAQSCTVRGVAQLLPSLLPGGSPRSANLTPCAVGPGRWRM